MTYFTNMYLKLLYTKYFVTTYTLACHLEVTHKLILGSVSVN